MTVDEDVETLADAGHLTERQAEAFVLRDVELVSREAAAETMGISVNVLDKHLAAARSKVDNAEATTEALQSIRFEDLPNRCSECDAALGGVFARDGDDGAPLCPPCAGVEDAM